MYSSDSLLIKMGFNGILCKKKKGDCQLHVCSTSGMAALWNSILNVGILNFYLQICKNSGKNVLGKSCSQKQVSLVLGD